MFFEHFQELRLHHIPGQPIPVADQSFGEFFLTCNLSLPWCNMSITSSPIARYMEEEANPHLSTISFRYL